MKLSFDTVAELEDFYNKLHPELNVEIIKNAKLSDCIIKSEREGAHYKLYAGFKINGTDYSSTKTFTIEEYSKDEFRQEFLREFFNKSFVSEFTNVIMKNIRFKY